jgi:inosose dehydratase
VSALLDRVAGAPITWGVCEVPGWGHQMSPERVLGEMAAIGVGGTELGPDGFLPTDPHALRDALDRARLALVGGFVPVVLHDRDHLRDELSRVERQADLLSGAGASVLVIAASTGAGGYDSTGSLDEDAWNALVEGLDRAVELADARGMVAALHPHHGTVIEGGDVERLLERSSVLLCLDTGHVAVGGADPLDVAGKAAGRVAHVHLKDVASDLVDRVRAGIIGYREAVGRGMYRPLGEGDLDVSAVVRTLERAGFDGWYVLEQDTVLASEPGPGAGPSADARTSYEYLRRLDRELGPAGDGKRERDAQARAGKEEP